MWTQNNNREYESKYFMCRVVEDSMYVCMTSCRRCFAVKSILISWIIAKQVIIINVEWWMYMDGWNGNTIRIRRIWNMRFSLIEMRNTNILLQLLSVKVSVDLPFTVAFSTFSPFLLHRCRKSAGGNVANPTELARAAWEKRVASEMCARVHLFLLVSV